MEDFTLTAKDLNFWQSPDNTTSYQTLRTITNPNPSQLMVEDSPLSPRIPSSDHFDIPQPVSHCNWKCEDLRQPSGWDDNVCLSIPSQSNVAVSTKGTGAGFRSRSNVPKPSYTCKSRPLYITNQGGLWPLRLPQIPICWSGEVTPKWVKPKSKQPDFQHFHYL